MGMIRDPGGNVISSAGEKVQQIPRTKNIFNVAFLMVTSP